MHISTNMSLIWSSEFIVAQNIALNNIVQDVHTVHVHTHGTSDVAHWPSSLNWISVAIAAII